MQQIKTYLPVFSGFYGTFWECNDEEREVEHVNEKRDELGLEPIKFNDCNFDYSAYNMRAVKGIAAYLEKNFTEFISGIEIEKIVSPREYNFKNDSVDVIISISDNNSHAIRAYLFNAMDDFNNYLKDKYTSRSGFTSFYPNKANEFLQSDWLTDKHKLGSVLDFILNHSHTGDDLELSIYYNIENHIECTNYDELTTLTV